MGHYFVPYEIVESKRAFARFLVNLWGVTALLSMVLSIYLYDVHTVEGIVGGLSMLLLFVVSTWQWMSKRQDYPSEVGWFAITPKEAVDELLLTELSDGSWEVKVKRHRIRHVANITPFIEVREKAGKRLDNESE